MFEGPLGILCALRRKLTEITSYDTFEIVIRRSGLCIDFSLNFDGLVPNDISSNNYDDDMMDPDLLAAIEASKQSYLEVFFNFLGNFMFYSKQASPWILLLLQVCGWVEECNHLDNAIVPPTESNNSNCIEFLMDREDSSSIAKTDSENAPAPAESSNQNGIEIVDSLIV